MRRLARDFLESVFVENVVVFASGIGSLAYVGLLIFHVLMIFGLLENWELCGVAPGPVGGLAFFIFWWSPIIAWIFILYYEGKDSITALVLFFVISGLIFSYDIWMNAAHMQRTGHSRLSGTENYVDSSFCSLTRAILPDKFSKQR